MATVKTQTTAKRVAYVCHIPKNIQAKIYIFRVLMNIPTVVVLAVSVVEVVVVVVVVVVAVVIVVVIGAQQSNPSGNSAPQLSKLS